MKKLLIVLALLFQITTTKAQIWGEQGATWHYSYWNVGEGGFIKIQYSGDTIINGKNCQVLYPVKYRFYYSSTTGMFFGGTSPYFHPEFTYTSGDTVFYWVNNNFKVLYNFNVQPGDYWDLGVDTNYFGCTKSKVIVDSIGTININNKTLKWVFVHSDSCSSKVLNGKIIQEIGCINNYLFPVDNVCNNICVDFDILNFLCFENNSLGNYNPDNTNCEPYLGLENVEFKEIKIYPNPASDYIYIENMAKNAKIEIFTLDGKLQQAFNIKGNISLNIKNLADGLYLVKMQTDKGVVVMKFLKQ